jgi:hypothetical protein
VDKEVKFMIGITEAVRRSSGARTRCISVVDSNKSCVVTVSKSEHHIHEVLSSDIASFSPLVVRETRSVCKEALARIVITVLKNPDKFLSRMVEVKIEVMRGTVRSTGVKSLCASELKLFNKIFVTDLSETTTFFRIKIDVVNENFSFVNKVHREIGRRNIVGSNNKFLTTGKFEVKTNLVILKSDKRKSKTRISAEPELKRDEKFSFRDVFTEVSEKRSITDHFTITTRLINIMSKFVPDIEPCSIVLIDLSTTDVHCNMVDKSMTKTTYPSNLTLRRSKRVKLDTKINLHHKITITLDNDRCLATEIGCASKRNCDTLDCKVGVSAIDNLEESNLRITSKIYILSAISD